MSNIFLANSWTSGDENTFFDSYPNEITSRNLHSIYINGICEVTSATLRTTVALNAPVRLYNIWSAFKRKDYFVVTCNVAAFATLFFPAGRFYALGCDVLAEVQNVINSSSVSPNPNGASLPLITKREKFSDLAEVCKYLGLPVDCNDSVKINNVIERNLNTWSRKQRHPQMSLYFAWQMQIVHDNLERARQLSSTNLDSAKNQEENLSDSLPHAPLPKEVKDLTPASFPNESTNRNVYSAYMNGICLFTQSSLSTTLALNVPIRVINVWSASQRKDYSALACNLLACAVLFFPYGGLVTIGCDLVILLRDAKNGNSSSKKLAGVGLPYEVKKEDFKSHIQACRFLYLPDSCSTPATINQRADKFIAAWQKRLKSSSMSPFYANQIQLMIENTENARNFLLDNPDFLTETD